MVVGKPGFLLLTLPSAVMIGRDENDWQSPDAVADSEGPRKGSPTPTVVRHVATAVKLNWTSGYPLEVTVLATRNPLWIKGLTLAWFSDYFHWHVKLTSWSR
jgi:hypothetical protein